MKSIVKLTLMAATALTTTPVYAQSSEDEAAEENSNIIIVTARKKEETLLDAPLAITAFGEQELEQAGYDDVVDIAKATPGLFIESYNSGVNNIARVNTTPRFRGIFVNSEARLQQTAAVFLDGIPIYGGIQTVGVNELQRVEITKGPQSALYGRNTFAGAINYVTKDPSNEFGGEIEGTLGLRDEYRIAAGIEGAIIPDILSFRVAGRYENVGGHYRNIANYGERLGDESQWNINGTLLFTPSDSVRVKIRGSYREVHDGAPAVIGGVFGPATHNFGGFLLDANCNAIAGAPTRQPSSNTQCSPGVVRTGTGNPNGEAAPFYGRTNSIFRGVIKGGAVPASEIGINTDFSVIQAFRDNLTNDARFDPATNAFLNDLTFNPFDKDDFGLDLEETRISGIAEFDLTDDISFTVLAGYSREAFGIFTELDATPDNSFTTFSASDIEDFSVEARLDGSIFDDRLTWSFGANYIDVEVKNLASTASNLFFPIVFGDGFRTSPFTSGAKTFGIFGLLDYKLTDRISVTLEGRYQEDKIIDETVNEGVPGLSPTTLSNFLPRATIKFEPTDNTTIYATYGRGNLPGGFNPEFASLDAVAAADVLSRSPSASSTFDEEKLENYELGWKQRLFGGRAAFNLAAFYMQRSDEIFRALETAPDTRPGATNPRRTVSFFGNGASTDIYGFELDANWVVSDAVTVGGSVSYIDAKIASFPANGGTDRFGLVFGPNVSPVGQQAPKFPPFTFSANATLEQPISSGPFDSWFVRGDLFFSDQYYVSNANLTEVESATDLNLRAGLRGENFSLEFFVTNVLNEKAPNSAQTFADTSFDVRLAPGGFFNFNAIGNRIGLRDKRDFGIRVGYSF